MGRDALAALALACLVSCDWGGTEKRLTPAERDIVARHVLAGAPPMRFPVNADLGVDATYLGLDVSPVPPRPGGTMTLTHYWRAGNFVFDWNVFVHLTGTVGGWVVNADHVPVQGLHPPGMWKKGEIVKDVHTVDLPPGVAGEVLIHVGMWRGSQRLPVTSGPVDPEGRILAARVPVGG